jgi:hypothetical protein
MSWDAGFIAALEQKQSLAFLFRLEFLRLKFGPSNGYTIDITNKEIQLESDSIRINGTRVQAQTFNATFGEFSLNLVGDYRVIKDKISRGAVAILYVGLKGYNSTNYQRLIWGQLSNIRKVNYNTFELIFNDALSLLNNRLDVRYDTGISVHKSGLYYTLNQSTNPTSNFNVNTDTNLYLADIDAFEKDSNTNGLIKIEEEHASDIFYAQWTSKTYTTAPAGYLTLATTAPFSPNYPTPSGVTIPSEIHTHATVYNVALIQDFPPHILGRVISRGTGNNLDTLPVSWGVSGSNGELPADLYDYADADAQKIYIKAASTTYNWRVPILEAQTEFARLFTDKASALGQFPVLRQGKISWRGVDDPYEPTTPNRIKNFVTDITDDDIIGVSSHDFFDPDANAVYSRFKIIYDQDGNTTTLARSADLESLPAYASAPSLGDGLTYDPTGTRVNMAVADGSRMEGYYRHTVEKITLITSMRMAQYVAGDNVRLTSSILYGTNEAGTYIRRIGMLSGVDIDFGSRSCYVTILFLPTLNQRNNR